MDKQKIEICLAAKCKGRGAGAVAALIDGKYENTASISKTIECFGCCGVGPNVIVEGRMMHQVYPEDALLRIEEELRGERKEKPSLGSKALDDLDSFLDAL